MTIAATLPFARAIGEYTTWLAVAEEDRSPAPAWWWSSALALRGSTEPMPAEWALPLGLPAETTIGSVAQLMLSTLADQTSQPWPDEFPRRFRRLDPSDGQSEPAKA